MIRKLLIAASLLVIAFLATMGMTTDHRAFAFSYSRKQTFREFRFERGNLLVTSITRWAIAEPARLGRTPELVLPETWLLSREALPMRSGLVAFYDTSTHVDAWPFAKNSGGMRVVRAVSGFGGDPNAGSWVQTIAPAQHDAELLPPPAFPTTNRIVLGSEYFGRLDATAIRQTVGANALGAEAVAASKSMDLGWRTEKTRSWSVAKLPALSPSPAPALGSPKSDSAFPSLYKPPPSAAPSANTPSYSLTSQTIMTDGKPAAASPPAPAPATGGIVGSGTLVSGRLLMSANSGMSVTRLFGGITNPYEQIIIPIWMLIVFASIPEMVFVVVAIVRLFRRRARRRRGECAACGYDLRGNPESGCPECGFGTGEQLVAVR